MTPQQISELEKAYDDLRSCEAAYCQCEPSEEPRARAILLCVQDQFAEIMEPYTMTVKYTGFIWRGGLWDHATTQRYYGEMDGLGSRMLRDYRSIMRRILRELKPRRGK